MLVTLKANAIEIGSAYATFSIAALISPFFIGLIADRFFASQRVLAFLHLLGACLLYLTADVQQTNVFCWFILGYTLLYTPTIALSNAISFNQMQEPGKDFPAIRVMGTIGWIMAGLLIGYLNLESSPQSFRLGALGSLILGLFCFLLPDTPPKKKAADIRSIVGLDALVLFKNRSFLLFFIVSILTCIPLTFYYNFANPFLNDIGVPNAAGKMTLGQISEGLFLLVIPLLFSRLGIKKMLAIGLLCWVLRYVLFAFGDPDTNLWMLLLGIFLHGACYDFFFVTGQIYTERNAGKEIKNAAQGLITFATYGIGMLIGSYLSGVLTERFVITDGVKVSYNWEEVWLIPAGISAVVLVLLILFFKENENAKTKKIEIE